MKLKKILALAVSLAMVLSIIPAFGLTASAAVDASWIGTDTLVYDGTQTDSAYAQGKKFIAVEFTLGTVSGYKDLAMTDADGKKIAGFCDAWLSNDGFYVPDGERSAAADNAVISESKGSIKFNDYSGNARIRALIENTGSQYTVEYSVIDGIGGRATNTFATMVYSGTANGISLPANWNYGGWGSGVSASNASGAFADFRVYAYTPATQVDVTATYTLNGETLTTVKSSYDTAKGETSVTFPEKYYSVNGENTLYYAEATELSADGEIAMAALDNPAAMAVGKCFTNNGAAYEIVSGNLVPNGDFSRGTAGWYNSAGGAAGFFTSNGDGTMTLTSGGTGAGGANSLYRAWATESGKTYLFTFYASTGNEYDKVSVKDDISATADGTIILNGGAAGTNQVVFTAANSYVQVNFRWLGTGNIFGNFGLYELADAADKVASTTVKFADVNGTELQASKTIAGFIGDVINFTDASVVPETITYNGVLYSKDASNPASHTVATAADEVTVTYSTDAVTSISKASATVIDGHTPLLPATLAATTGTGAATTVTVTSWDTSSLAVGSNTVYGTVDGLELKAEAEVTVLPVTFTLADKTTVNGQTAANNNVTAFPDSIKDSFVMEMDIVVESYGDLFITLKTAADTGFFGPEQIALGFHKETGYFRPVNGNGSGGRATDPDADLLAITAGTKYHLQVVSNPAEHKYTVTIFDDNGNSAVAENFGYRTNADSIGYLAMLTNNGSGSITATNIRVYNATLEAKKAEYTVVTVVDGVEESRTTGTYISADQITAAEREGYQLKKTVEGTTVTFTYVSTTTVDVKFVNAANTDEVIYSASQVVSKGGSFTVPKQEIFVIASDNSGAFYQIEETVVNAAGMVVEVSETPNKYAAMEDMLVDPDSQVWGIKATNNNSVFVAGTNSGPEKDANGDNVYGTFAANLGKARTGFVQFPVVDVTEGQKVTANFFVRSWHAQTWTTNEGAVNNDKIRLAATVINDSSWTALSDGGTYVADSAPVFDGYTNYIFSDWATSSSEKVTFDITEAMMAAKAANLETITLKLQIYFGAAYIAEREAAVLGGKYEGKAAYIEVSDPGLFKVTATGAAELTKNGSAMNGVAYVAAADDVRLVAPGAIVVKTNDGYYKANKNLNLTAATDFLNTAPKALGLAMVDGAQVRIGATELADDVKPGALVDSGLRFLATANKTDAVLDDVNNVEYGIRVTAKDADVPAYIKAEKFQSADVFSAAVTNLRESNYNRPYTATAYALVTMADGTTEEFNSANPVTRSIYQVSAGIMKNGSADADNAKYTVDGVVKNILNAYINQTGIRLKYKEDGAVAVEDNKYTGDVFFDVTYTDNGDGSVNVTIAPDSSWGTSVKIASWWIDYVRINNNNSIVRGCITNENISPEGVLTFTFTPPADAQ